jgi:hypothetical protein
MTNTPRRLLVEIDRARKELQALGVARGDGDPLAGYAEHLVAQAVGAQLAPAGTQGYDLISMDGARLQVKARRPNPPTAIPQWGGLKADADGKLKDDFDQLVGVVFDGTYNVVRAVVLSRDAVAKGARVQYRNGRADAYRLRADVATCALGEDVTGLLRAVQEREGGERS